MSEPSEEKDDEEDMGDTVITSVLLTELPYRLSRCTEVLIFSDIADT